MSLDTQLTTLIAEAPQDGKTPQAIQQIAPMLKAVAQNLGVLQFYILQNLEGQWQMTTLQNQHQPGLEKTVIYAYQNLQAATRSSSRADLIAMPVPVIQLLFQLLTMKPVDSLVLKGQTLQPNNTVEINREQFQQLIQQQLQQSPTIPPDIA